MSTKRWLVVFVVLVVAVAISGFMAYVKKHTVSPSVPTPLPAMPDPYSDPDLIWVLYSGVLVKHAPGGVVVRGVWDRDAQGVFIPIPDAVDFHQLKDSEGARTPYYRAADAIYVFHVLPDAKKDSLGNELPVPVRMDNVDVPTFIPGAVSGILYIAKDKNRVYFAGVADSTIDPTTLTGVDGRPSLIKDASHVYELGGISYYTVTPFDPKTFAFLAPRGGQLDSVFEGYVKDKNGVYFEKEKIAGADSETFTVFTSPPLHGLKGGGPAYSYAKDKNFVYYNGAIVPHADPATFIPVDGEGVYSYYYGKDANAVYEGTTTIPKLDPRTVRILWYPMYEGCGLSPYVKDAEHVFFQHTLIPDADASTFESLINGYGRDKNGIWERTQFRPDLPKDFKPECNYG